MGSHFPVVLPVATSSTSGRFRLGTGTTRRRAQKSIRGGRGRELKAVRKGWEGPQASAVAVIPQRSCRFYREIDLDEARKKQVQLPSDKWNTKNKAQLVEDWGRLLKRARCFQLLQTEDDLARLRFQMARGVSVRYQTQRAKMRHVARNTSEPRFQDLQASTNWADGLLRAATNPICFGRKGLWCIREPSERSK